MWQYLDGELSLDEAIALMKKNTRNYAKRQTTWFRNNGSTMWMASQKNELKEHLLTRFNKYKKSI